MLPLSLVEHKAFIEFVNYLDPSFSMPTRKTIKCSGSPNLKDDILKQLKKTLNNIKYPYASVDGWSDATARKFNGYFCQGIDNDWNLVTLPVEFQYSKALLLAMLSISSIKK